MDMSRTYFWSALALSAVSILACGAPSLAKDRSDDSSKSNSASSDDSSGRTQDNQKSAKDEATDQNDKPADAKHHAALGVSLQDDDGRLHVIAVLPGSPAALAGIRNGDEITSADGERVRTAQQLADEIGEKQPGDQVSLGIRRNGDRQTLRAKLVSLDMLRSRNNAAERNRSDNDTTENMSRTSRPTWTNNRGRSASYDEDQMVAQQRDRMARQLRALQQQVLRLEQEVDDLRANRSAQQTSAYRGNVGSQGNGDNSWYYQSQPEDQNQGIHDYGARARWPIMESRLSTANRSV